MNACELTLSITLLANAIASKVTDDELELLAVIFTQLGDTLTTISVQRSIEPAKTNKNKEK